MGYISIIFLIVLGCQSNQLKLDEYAELMNDWKVFDQRISTMEIAQRDLLLLRLAVQHPSKSSHLCKRVQSKNAIEKCKQVIGRPHLTTPRSQ